MVPFNAYLNMEIMPGSKEDLSDKKPNLTQSVDNLKLTQLCEIDLANKKLTRAEKVVKLLVKGMSVTEISTILGIPIKYVRAYMYKNVGCIIALDPNFETSDAYMDALLQMWKHADEILQKAANGVSCSALVTEYNIPNIRALKRFLNQKADELSKINPNFDLTILQSVPKIEVLKCIANNEKITDIAEKYGLSPWTVYSYRNTYIDDILQVNPEFNCNKKSEDSADSVDIADNGYSGVSVDNEDNEDNVDNEISAICEKSGLKLKLRTMKIIKCFATKEPARNICAMFGVTDKSLYKYKYRYIDIILQLNPKFISNLELQIVSCIVNNEDKQAIADKFSVKLKYIERVWKLYQKAVPTLISLGLLARTTENVTHNGNVSDKMMEPGVKQALASDEINLYEDAEKHSKWHTAEITEVIVEPIDENVVMEVNDMSNTVKEEKYDLISCLREDIRTMRMQKDSSADSMRSANLETLEILKDLINGKPIDFIAFEHGKTRNSLKQLKAVYKPLLLKYTSTLPENYKKSRIKLANRDRLLHKIASGVSFERVSNEFAVDIAVIVQYCRQNVGQLLAINPNFDVNSIPSERQFMSHKERLNEIIRRIADNEDMQVIASDFKRAPTYIQQICNNHMEDILKINPNFENVRKTAAKSAHLADNMAVSESTACDECSTGATQTNLHHIYAKELPVKGENVESSTDISVNGHNKDGHEEQKAWTAVTIAVAIEAVNNEINQCKANISEYEELIKALETRIDSLNNAKDLLIMANGGVS